MNTGSRQYDHVVSYSIPTRTINRLLNHTTCRRYHPVPSDNAATLYTALIPFPPIPSTAPRVPPRGATSPAAQHEPSPPPDSRRRPRYRCTPGCLVELARVIVGADETNVARIRRVDDGAAAVAVVVDREESTSNVGEIGEDVCSGAVGEEGLRDLAGPRRALIRSQVAAMIGRSANNRCTAHPRNGAVTVGLWGLWATGRSLISLATFLAGKECVWRVL